MIKYVIFHHLKRFFTFSDKNNERTTVKTLPAIRELSSFARLQSCP